jgi:drug/metabolite transporter (DMT)-like permease
VIEDCVFEPPSNALGPLWVWRAFAETPGMPALIGGALVLLAVIGYLTLPRLGEPRSTHHNHCDGTL